MRLKGHVQKIVKLFCEEKWPSMLLHLQIILLSTIIMLRVLVWLSWHDMILILFNKSKLSARQITHHVCIQFNVVTLNAIIIPHFCAYFRNNGDQHLVKLWIPPLSFCLTFLRQHPKNLHKTVALKFHRDSYILCGHIMSLWLKDKANLERCKE